MPIRHSTHSTHAVGTHQSHSYPCQLLPLKSYKRGSIKAYLLLQVLTFYHSGHLACVRAQCLAYRDYKEFINGKFWAILAASAAHSRPDSSKMPGNLKHNVILMDMIFDDSNYIS